MRRELVEREIKENAARLFSERGVAGTTLQDIADATGLTRQAVYHYVANKDELFIQLVSEIAGQAAQILHQVNAMPDVSPPDKLRCMAQSMARHQMANADRFRLIIRSEGDLPEHLAESYDTSRRQVLKELIEVIKAGVDDGSFRAVNARTAALGIIGMLNWIAWWHLDGSEDEVAANELADMVVRTVIGQDSEPQPPTVEGILAHVRLELDEVQRLADARNPPDSS